MMRLAMGGIAVLAAGTGVFVAVTMRGQAGQFAHCGETAIAGSGIGGPFSLIDETGRDVTDADIITGPTLVYFGYTFCPDVCPLDSVRNADAVDLLEAAGHTVTPVFITVDPARDTPEQMAQFTDFIDERMIGLSGSEEQVRGAISAYKAYAEAVPTGDEFYLVNHSSFTYLVLPEYGALDFFRSAATAVQIAQTTACYIEAA